jgi:hypothetical protein
MPNGPDQPPKYSTRTKSRFVNLAPPGRLDFEFILRSIKGLSVAASRSREPLKSEAGIIDQTFAGVGLAVPKNAAATAEVLELVDDLGVKAVRIDYSEEHSIDAVTPLLQGLKGLGVKVLLHLVQTRDQAKEMPNEAVTAAWVLFLNQTLDALEGTFEAVEIGSTINRATWTGYSLAGFLAAWEAAYPIIRQRGITLVGPNVTDFEPQYNAGVLGMLKRRQCLPDIHSNNMFAERAIQPEAIDRKIIGESFKRLHGFDLVKKLRLIAAIATRHGLSTSWSTSAFWTLPRIRRILNSSEEQMADYLARYFIICAAEGSFERCYWGPLIAGREGLIDDGLGDLDYKTKPDVVAYYPEIPGEPRQWRRRPAFDTFKQVQSILSGAVYLKRLGGSGGLEIHAFKKGDQVVHAVWTMNGGLALAADIYSEELLSRVDCVYTRDGEMQSLPPEYFCQSPVYLVWNSESSVEIAAHAAVVKDAIVARAEVGYDYYSYQTDSWRGTIYARSRADADKLIEALQPDAIQAATKETILRKARNAIWTVDDPIHAVQSLVVKKPARIAWHKQILDRRKPSKSLRSWNGTSELMRRGIETPKVVACFEHRDASRLLDNWFVCEHANTRHSVRSFFSAYASGEETVEGFTFEAFSAALLEFVHRVHWRGVYFRDLSGGNVLVRIEDDNRLVFSLIDTARARFANKRFSRSKRIADLKRLVFKLDPERQQNFMQAYLEKERAKFTGIHRLGFKLYAIKAWLKRMKRSVRKKILAK